MNRAKRFQRPIAVTFFLILISAGLSLCTTVSFSFSCLYLLALIGLPIWIGCDELKKSYKILLTLLMLAGTALLLHERRPVIAVVLYGVIVISPMAMSWLEETAGLKKMSMKTIRGILTAVLCAVLLTYIVYVNMSV